MQNGIPALAQQKERIEWVDTLKGFAIFCVTLGHLSAWAPIEKYIYSFHMFLFFFLSGFLFSVKKPIKEILKKRFERILIPFIAWNIVSALIGYVIVERNPTNLLEELFVINGNLTCNAPIWFLLVLFISETIILVLRLYKYKWLTISSIALCLILWVLLGHQWLLWKLNLVPMAISFFLFGYLMKDGIHIINKWYFIIPAGVGSIVLSALNVRIMYTYGSFGNYFYCIPAACLGVIFFVGLFSRIKVFSRLTFLKSWGKNSLIIMATQTFLLIAISFSSTALIGIDLKDYQNTVVALFLAVLVTALINCLTILYQKYTQKSAFFRGVGRVFGVQY